MREHLKSIRDVFGGVLRWFSEKKTVKMSIDQEQEGKASMSIISPNASSKQPALAYMPTAQLRDVCWKDIENVEHWARRLINEIMIESYGEDYFNYSDDNGNRIIKMEIVRTLQSRIESDPRRFPRMVDALTLENIIEILCNQTLYDKHFKDALEYAYPCGPKDARHHITIIKDVRNKYTHLNVISIRDAERAICYSHDFIDSLKEYYQKTGKEKDYNVPTFVKFTDSQGLIHHFSSGGNNWFDLDTKCSNIKLRSGDVYRVEVEVDPSFDSNGYEVDWCYEWKYDEETKVRNKLSIDIPVTNEMVGRYLKISCSITTHKDWHKHGSYDDYFLYEIKTILPPIEDNY